jgi:Ras-related protein Rab-6A
MSAQNQINPEIPKYKLIFLGDQGVGKSCILNRFMNGTFTEEYQATIGLDFQSKNVQIDNQDIHLLLYDTAGQEKFRSLIPMYTRDANIILLVYEVTSKDSFLHLNHWLNDLTTVKKDEVIFVVVGNKTDLEDKREVSREEGEQFAKDNDYLFAEVSAKNGKGFQDLFYKNLFERIRTKFRPGGQQPTTEVKDIKLTNEQEEKKKVTKKGCC